MCGILRVWSYEMQSAITAREIISLVILLAATCPTFSGPGCISNILQIARGCAFCWRVDAMNPGTILDADVRPTELSESLTSRVTV